MKAVVFHGIGDIRLDDVPEPKFEQPTDAIVRLTSSAICGTDLHIFVKRSYPNAGIRASVGAPWIAIRTPLSTFSGWEAADSEQSL